MTLTVEQILKIIPESQHEEFLGLAREMKGIQDRSEASHRWDEHGNFVTERYAAHRRVAIANQGDGRCGKSLTSYEPSQRKQRRQR